MSKDYDRFGDVQEDARGIFGDNQSGLDAGLKRHEQVHAQSTAEGVIMQLTCQGCGRPTHLTIEWPEVVALKYGINPQEAFRNHQDMVKFPTRWEFLAKEHAWRPDLKCSNCQFWFPLRVSPEEPERYLAVGRQNGYINQGGEKLVSAVAVKAAQMGQAARR